MQLGHTLKADGRWRLIAFAATGDRGQIGGGIALLCDFLTNNPASPVIRFTPKGADIDSLFDLRAVFQLPRQNMTLETLPNLLLPAKGIHQLTDYEKAFCPDLKQGPDIFDSRGIDRDTGALLIIRPDQYVAHVLPQDGFEELAIFFQNVMGL